jgi:outer membrane receptor protein involved in Fe transport
MLTLGMTGVAYAQDAAAGEGEVEAIVVTGSRLQSGFQTPTPVTVVGTQSFEQRAVTTIAEAVNELPSFRQTTTNTQTQRGNGNGGQNGVDLRGLGRNRTLVLLDGRRFVPTNIGGTIDINQIPTPLISRVEVVTGGASAAYGSDAVSGVVNFIVKDRIDGVEGTYQYGQTTRGDSKEPGFSLAAGTTFLNGRGRIVVGGDWSDNKGMGTIYSRDYGREQYGFVQFGSVATRGGLPAQGLVPNVTRSGQTDGSVIISGPLKGTAFGAGGAPFQLQYGQVYSDLMIGGNNGPDASPFGRWLMAAPSRRYNGLARVTYDVTDTMSVWAEYGYAFQQSDTEITYHQTASMVVPISNPYIPAATRAAMIANNLSSITIGRYESELNGYLFDIHDITNRGAAGIKGEFGGIRWDASYSHGVAKGHSILFTNIAEGNWLAATYVVPGPNGQPICGPLATNPNIGSRAGQVTPGCQPFNIFGRNSASQEAKDYIRGTSDTATRIVQDLVQANVSAEPFSTWAGPVALAAGGEWRKEQATSQQNAFSILTPGLSNNGSTYGGSVTVHEGYLEAGVPLARDMAFAQTFDLNGAVRRTHYDTSGSVTTWKVGATWDVNDWLRLRGTRSRDIRAPNITDLFASGGRGITASGSNPIKGTTGALFTQSGGNPNLTPEIADSVTAGVVLQPSGALSGLRVAVDYFSVDIEDVISSVSATNILNRCAQGLQEYCSLIDFDNSPFGIAQVRTQPANLDRLKTSGVDFELAYRVPLDNWNIPGDLTVQNFTTWVDTLATTDAVGTIDRAGVARGGVPEWTSNLNFTYRINRLSNSIQFKYNSAVIGDADLIGPEQDGYSPTLTNSINKNKWPSAVYMAWSMSYDIINADGKKLQVFGVINNLLDKQPPAGTLIGLLNGGNPYDLYGRRWRAGVRFAF